MQKQEQSKSMHYIGHRSRVKQRIIEMRDLSGFADYEILEALLFFCNTRADVKPIAKEMLQEFKSIDKIEQAEIKALERYDQTGRNLFLLLKLTKEFGTRAHATLLSGHHSIDKLDKFSKITQYLISKLRHLKVEEFRVLMLDPQLRLIKDVAVSVGTITESAVYTRAILESVVHNSATSVILSHNHPFGVSDPSQNDISITQDIVSSLRFINVIVQDHVIIGQTDCFSFRKNGLIEDY